MGAAAGAVVFLLAVLVGVAWFSPDSSSADTPEPDTTVGVESSAPAATVPGGASTGS